MKLLKVKLLKFSFKKVLELFKANDLSSPLVAGEKVLNLLLFPDVWLVSVEDIKDDPEFGFDPFGLKILFHVQ